MKPILSILFCILTFVANASAAPDCYKNAPLPAHVWALDGAGNNTEITSIADDGQQCVTTKLWKGLPIFRRQLNAPFISLYEAYAKAVWEKRTEAVYRLFTWVRPTPRTFHMWTEMFAEHAAPMPWGTPGLIEVIKVLDQQLDGTSIPLDNESMKGRATQGKWAWLFINMGGLIYPDGESTYSSVNAEGCRDKLSARYPGINLVVYKFKKEDDGQFNHGFGFETRVRME